MCCVWCCMLHVGTTSCVCVDITSGHLNVREEASATGAIIGMVSTSNFLKLPTETQFFNSGTRRGMPRIDDVMLWWVVQSDLWKSFWLRQQRFCWASCNLQCSYTASWTSSSHASDRRLNPNGHSWLKLLLKLKLKHLLFSDCRAGNLCLLQRKLKR